MILGLVQVNFSRVQCLEVNGSCKFTNINRYVGYFSSLSPLSSIKYQTEMIPKAC